MNAQDSGGKTALLCLNLAAASDSKIRFCQVLLTCPGFHSVSVTSKEGEDAVTYLRKTDAAAADWLEERIANLNGNQARMGQALFAASLGIGELSVGQWHDRLANLQR